MPKDAIFIDQTTTTSTQAQSLKRLSQLAREFTNQVQDVLAVMQHNNDGTDWTDLELIFGLSAGKGQGVYNLVNGAANAIKGTAQNANIKTLGEVFV